MRHLVIVFCFFFWSSFSSCFGQVIPDGSLSTSVLTDDGLNYQVLDGKQVKKNLFHSFESLSVPRGGSLSFLNSVDTQNIFVRVLAKEARVDGLLETKGTANLFLMSPSGIRFGEYSSLNIGGSLFATTADKILFEDGNIFYSKSQPEELLVDSIPSEFVFSSKPGDIKVFGNSQGIQVFEFINGAFQAIPPRRLPRNNASELKLKPTRGFSLIGGDIYINGGVIAAPGGNVRIVSAKEGSSVPLNPATELQAIAGQGIKNLGLLQLSGAALIDVGGVQGGEIELIGNKIRLSEGSKLVNYIQGDNGGGLIRVSATETVKLSGYQNDFDLIGVPVSYITSQTSGNAQAGNIEISTKDLFLLDGGIIASASLSSGRAGDILINSSGHVNVVDGFSEFDPSIIISQTYSLGDSGNISIEASVLNLLGGGRITSSSLGSGNAGHVQVVAQDINVGGTLFENRSSQSSLSSTSFDSGNSGDLSITANTIQLFDSGDILASAYSRGNSGTVDIEAYKEISIDGKVLILSEAGTVEFDPSTISSSAPVRSQDFRDFFQLPPQPFGKSGNVTINTPKLTITNGAEVTVANDGPQDAGNINITADQLILQNQGQITSSTANGNGGNILLNVNQALGLTNNSNIRTNAQGPGNGGNITINSRFIATRIPTDRRTQDNNITANAIDGNGGNISITTLKLLGIDQADRDWPNRNDITASSETGVQGTVTINNEDIDLIRGLFEGPPQLNTEKLIANSCLTEEGRHRSRPVALSSTGSGGIPYDPIDKPLSNHFHTYRLPQAGETYAQRQGGVVATQPDLDLFPFEANKIYKRPNGEIILGQSCA